MRAAPRSRALLTDMTPVDFVATACAHLFRTFMRDPSAFGDSTATPTFHLWNDRYACFDDITACFAEYGLPAQVMTYDDWITRIRGSDSRRYPIEKKKKKKKKQRKIKEKKRRDHLLTYLFSPIFFYSSYLLFFFSSPAAIRCMHCCHFFLRKIEET